MKARILGVLAAAVALSGLVATPAGADAEPWLSGLHEVFVDKPEVSFYVSCPNKDWQPVRSPMFAEPVQPKPGTHNPTEGHGTGRLAPTVKQWTLYPVTFGCGSVTRTIQITVQEPETRYRIGLEVIPAAARPGEAVKVVQTCYKSNRPLTHPVSLALPKLANPVGTSGERTYETTVNTYVKPGRYPVQFQCGAHISRTYLTVLEGSG